jgi:hypothetical protein
LNRLQKRLWPVATIGSEFLVMLNTWEAAVKFLAPRGAKKSAAVDVRAAGRDDAAMATF